ncbi:extracellular solute-binding protein [Paenibacillus sepulcri]|uniref:Extracellular solute-binding protein n=1 Tax=Paenibacillus sepulcri TaxID=359917 RepID=A0ABS7BZC4_9BACL|nr:extracellular solute-binding protein [Paenibacillus sepulcri]
MKRKKQMMLAAALVFGLTVLSGCSGNASPGGSEGNAPSGASGEAASAPTAIKIMSAFSTANPPDPKGDVQKAIEEATNTKLDIQWVSANNYKERLNVSLSSGDIADVVMIDDPFSTVFRTSAKQGAFWDLTELYGKYPNILKQVPAAAWEASKMQDGKNYGIPRPRGAEGARYFVIRKDWLDKLGLQVPTTTDELYTVMKAFKEQDPDGNGKDDTIGFTANVLPTDMGTLGIIINSFTGANGTGATGSWVVRDGKLENADLLPETREALEYLNKAYKDGLIPADFASLKPSQVDEIYASGKAGIIADKTGNMQEMISKLGKVDPTAKDEQAFYPVTSINGYNPKGPGFLGMLAISKKVPEEKLDAILTAIDKWMTPEVFDLQTWGIEGTHYTVKDGNKEPIQDKYEASGIENYNQIVYVADPYANSLHRNFPQASIDLYTKLQDEKAKTSKPDESIGLYSETFQSYGPELAKQAQDIKTKVILGVAPLTAWDDFVNKMKSDPQMTKIVQEMNDAYQERSGK